MKLRVELEDLEVIIEQLEDELKHAKARIEALEDAINWATTYLTGEL